MLGYIVAGIIIGPATLGLIDQSKSIVQLGEIGITLLLFIVGLELSPGRLRVLRSSIVKLGGAQVIVTSAVFSSICYFFGFTLPQSLTIGLALSLSSTAFALSYLTNSNQLTASHGQASLSILLFQDLIIVPVLALIPLATLGGGESVLSWQSIFYKSLGIAGMLFFCAYPLKHAISYIKRTQDREITLAAFLFFIISMSMGMEKFGFSMSIGAFVAGVFLANSEVKTDLYRSISPFKGILMGLFFMTLGIDVNFSYIGEHLSTLLKIVAAIVLVKGAIVGAMAYFKSFNNKSLFKMSFLLFQTGEFGIVVLERAGHLKIFNAETTQLFVTSALITMVISPLVIRLSDSLLEKQVQVEESPAPDNVIDLATVKESTSDQEEVTDHKAANEEAEQIAS